MEEDTVRLYPCGSMVTTWVGEVNGMITAQTIRFGSVQYEITYFTDQQRTMWMSEKEFHCKEDKEVFGFRKIQ